MNETVNGQDYIQALQMQRERAMNDIAMAVARNTQLQRELEAVTNERNELRKKLEEKG